PLLPYTTLFRSYPCGSPGARHANDVPLRATRRTRAPAAIPHATVLGPAGRHGCRHRVKVFAEERRWREVSVGPPRAFGGGGLIHANDDGPADPRRADRDRTSGAL